MCVAANGNNFRFMFIKFRGSLQIRFDVWELLNGLMTMALVTGSVERGLGVGLSYGYQNHLLRKLF